VVHLFTGNGGDINTIIDKAKFINARCNFGKENLYNISLDEFKEALDIFVENKNGKKDEPPFGMYN